MEEIKKVGTENEQAAPEENKEVTEAVEPQDKTEDDAAAADRMISTLMGDNVDARKSYIYQYANFNRQDEIEKKGYLNV